MSKIKAGEVSQGAGLTLDAASQMQRQLAVSLEKIKQHLITEALAKRAELLEAARQEISALHQQAVEEKESLCKTARQEADAIREVARQEGFNAGYAQGEASIRCELADQLTGAQAFYRTLLQGKDSLLHDLQADLSRLTQIICERILNHALTDHPEHWMTIAEAAVSQLADQKSCTLVLQASVVTALKNAGYPKATPAIRLLADAQLEPHQAYLLCEGGPHLDLSLDTQIQMLLSQSQSGTAQQTGVSAD